MQKRDIKGRPIESKPLHLRRLTKSGSSRYLSVGTIVPAEWVNVKVYVEQLDKTVCVLRLVPIE